MKSKFAFLILVVMVLDLTASCLPDNYFSRFQKSDRTTLIQDHKPDQPSTETYSPTEIQEFTESFTATYSQPDGNRIMGGTGGENIEEFEIQLEGKPIWLMAITDGDYLVWFVVMENGEIQTFSLTDGSVKEISSNPQLLPPGMPPVVMNDEVAGMLQLPPSDASILSHSVFLSDGRMAYIDKEGHLKVGIEPDISIIQIECLPDARILVDENDRLLILTDPVTSYPHGALGDNFEASSITIVDTRSDPPQISRIEIDDKDVIEGITAIWVDVDLDGERDVVVTQSNAIDGARIVVYRKDGSVLAETDPIGTGFRWTHQLAAAQFIEGGPLEIVAVRTPHIGGTIEIFSLENSGLKLTATVSGYSSHAINERNLDRALVGDFNGDGKLEIAIPDQAQRKLAGIQFIEGDLNEIWSLPMNGRLSTNLAATVIDNGLMALGAGTDENLLLVWTIQ